MKDSEFDMACVTVTLLVLLAAIFIGFGLLMAHAPWVIGIMAMLVIWAMVCRGIYVIYCAWRKHR